MAVKDLEGKKIVKKLWGAEYWLVNTELYCLKILVINPGFQSSLHYHKKKDETFFVEKGEVLLECGDSTEQLLPGMRKRIKPGVRHRFSSVKDISVIMEVSTTHEDEDVFRIEESMKKN